MSNDAVGDGIGAHDDAPSGYLPLAGFSIPPATCSAACDDTHIWWTGLDYYYLGQHYTDILMSSNGFLVPGTDATAAFTSLNSALRGGEEALGDMALLGRSGTWTRRSRRSRRGRRWPRGRSRPMAEHLVCLRVGGAPGMGPHLRSSSYSFQVWIEVGTDKIWFVYGT